MEKPNSVSRLIVLLCFSLLGACLAVAQSDVSRAVVQVDKPSIKVSPTFYGLMTEEINHAYDGGLYGELLRNRALKDSATRPLHWSVVVSGSGAGTIELDQDGTSGTPCLKVSIETANATDRVGVANEGYWGVPVKARTAYRASFFAKSSSGFSGPLIVSLESRAGNGVYAQAKVAAIGADWHRYSVELRTGELVPSMDNQFVISANHAGTVWLKTVSLFPPTFKKRPNGNRIDLMQLLDGMKPSFLRLPGGNYLEGNTIAERFNWKATLGDISERSGHQCPWGYYSTDGLGLLEYLEWCEDLRMKPVLAVYAGYSLRGMHVNPGPDLAPYVQDALDEIEYVTGGPNTKWGAVRAKDGHPRPFPLTYVEIGNEDGFDRSGAYEGRFAQFFDAIKARYPGLQIIATAPIRSRRPDVIDDHYYRSAAEMASDSGHYDRTSRQGPKIFVGEWASIEGSPTPTYQAALGDAAWLIGLERNSDLVVMESYAPLFVNVNPRAAQWPTNLIGYDALNSFGSPSYYVQSLYAKNTGDVELPVNLALAQGKPRPAYRPNGAIGLGTWLTTSEYKDATVTVDGKQVYQKDFAAGTDGWSLGRGRWSVEDGALRQTGSGEDTHAVAGDPNWTDYTYRVKARKVSGAEGFLILFHVRSSRNYWQWNVGGWGDSRSAIQRHWEGTTEEVGEATDTTIETGRWYDIGIETHGTDVKCYLDGKLITEVTEVLPEPGKPLYVGASRVTSSGVVILKVVNTSGDAQALTVSLAGAAGVDATAPGWEMVGQPEDQNSIKEPMKVSPKPIVVDKAAREFTRTYPPYSVTVIRLKVRT